MFEFLCTGPVARGRETRRFPNIATRLYRLTDRTLVSWFFGAWLFSAWFLAAWLLASWFFGTSIARAQIGEGRSVPRQSYFYVFDVFNQGEYRDSMRGFRSAAASGVNTGVGRWVDSICYFTMMGECSYHMGDLAGALSRYDSALQLVIVHNRNGWLKRLELTPVARPLATTTRVTWGPTARNPTPGDFRDTMLSRRGTNLDTTLRYGGAVVAPELFPIRVTEIMRCTALALRRRRQILGPLAPHTRLTQEVVTSLSSRQVPANHWLQTYINVQLAIAKASAGDRDDAIELLQRSLVAAGRFDHHLTSIALLEIGDLAMKKNDLELAQRSYFEASFPAAFFGQADALEEALTGAARIHTIKNESGIFAPLRTAAEWCRRENLDRAAAALLLSAAEQAVMNNDAQQAVKWLAQARSAMGRSDLRAADLGVELLYHSALIALNNGESASGMKALSDAYRLHRNHSKRLFQLGVTNRLYASNELSSRVAGAMLAYLLREPTARDWRRNRYETMLFEATPHLPVLHQWLDLLLENAAGGNFDKLVLASEMIRRHKFFGRLPMAGRLLALRWVLEAPDVMLDDETRDQRQSMLDKYADLATRSRNIKQLQAQLRQIPLAPKGSDEWKTIERIGKDLARTSDAQEDALMRIALRNDPAKRMFPPLLSLEQVQGRMKNGQAILAFVARNQEMYAMLLTPDKRYKTWRLEASGPMRSELTTLMREIGNFDSKQVLPAERLTNERWKDFAASLFAPITAELSAEALTKLRELVIVPDGFLWYLPFEMLQINVGDERRNLIDVVPIRYAPTIGLAVQDARPKQASGPRVIVHGRMFSRETGEILATAAEQLKNQQARGVVLRQRLPHASRYLASVWELLVVLDDIEGIDKDSLGWSPAQIDQGTPGGTLASWMALPWGAPDVVVLPGYHTAAENGMRGRNNGDELLITTCGLMATGTRTIVLSRWRTAGRTSMELLREFLQELPTQTAANAWQRSVLLARSGELDPSSEPRLKGVRPGEVPMGDHPFFWAGYLMMGAW